MNLYHISQDENGEYDTYSDAVVAAENEESARFIHPSEWRNPNWDGKKVGYDSWTDAENVTVKLIGVAESHIKKGVVCASFHAG
jgi:hypothetical protein